jgi:hypothetical protein
MGRTKHVVGFSGGIDSQACAGWVLERYGPEDVVLMNSDAGGNEHPLTTEHVLWYSANVHPVVMITPTIADMGNRSPGAIRERGLKPDDPLTFPLLAALKGRYPSRREWAARFPEMIDKVRRWEHEVGRTFFAPIVPGKAINWVDEVVEWAKTTRGGRQLALPFAEADAANGTCVSKYGLCE